MPSAQQTGARLAERGYQVDYAPFLSIKTHPPDPELPETPSGFILTSPNGAKALCDHPRAETFRAKPIWTVGAKTSSFLRHHHFTKIYQADQNVQSLIELLKHHPEAHLGTLCYLRGKEVHQPLQTLLYPFGIKIQDHICYQAALGNTFPLSVATQLEQNDFSGVLIYSRRTGDAFRRTCDAYGLTKNLRQNIHIFCLSKQIAVDFEQQGWHKTHNPESSHEEKLFDLIETVFHV